MNNYPIFKFQMLSYNYKKLNKINCGIIGLRRNNSLKILLCFNVKKIFLIKFQETKLYNKF
jgi:hypothetical protein